MPAKVVVGVQWGDEGKGKIIDILASRADVVVRSQGGNNAGHTVKSGDQVYKLRLIPYGILYENTQCFIGCGVVVNPPSLLEEMAELKKRGLSLDHLWIDPRAHLVMPWHIALDGLSEKMRGNSEIGTTHRGIGPCYMDKSERSGLRMYDLIHPEIFRKKAAEVGFLKNRFITEIYGEKPLDISTIIEQFVEYGQKLAPFVADVSVRTWQAIKEGKQVLFEGAQGTLLDLDMGTYPYVTSSHPLSGGVCTGTGIGPTVIDQVIGVAKAYTTRVGKGPFPTELFDETGDQIRNRGNEFGTNTGRPRRIGWFDSVILRHAVRANGLTCLAVNKLDTLSGLPTLKICVAYQKPDGTRLEHYPCSLEELEQCTPVYEELPGFSEDVSDCTAFEELPEACQHYLSRIEELCECPVAMVGVGPSRSQNLERTV